MEKLGKSLKELARELKLEPLWRAGAVFSRWPEVVGPQVAAHCEPVSVRDGILFIRTSSPVWSHQLSTLRPTLISKLAALGVTVSDIRFRAGPLEPAPAGAARPPARRTPRAAPPEAQAIADERLRQALVGALGGSGKASAHPQNEPDL